MIRISSLKSQEVSESVFMISLEMTQTQSRTSLKTCNRGIMKREGATLLTFMEEFKKHLQETFNLFSLTWKVKRK